MPISFEYINVLRELAVKRFVEANRRSPTVAELNDIILTFKKKYYAVDDIGISGFDLVKPAFRSSGSADQENANRLALFSDFMTLNTRLNKLIDSEESAYRGASSTMFRVNKTLDELLERLDNLLLIYGTDDLFLSGVEETFSHQTLVDRERTNASVMPNNVTLGSRRLDVVDLSQARFKITPIADKGFISYDANSKVSSLKEDDGNIWRATVKTAYQLGRVSLVLEITLPEATDISTVFVSGLPVEGNKIMTCTAFYSTSGSSFTPLEPYERRVVTNLTIAVNAKGVKKLQLVFSKDAADTGSPESNEYSYSFLFDKISIEQTSYELSDRSTLVMGPYEIYSATGDPVYFSKATLKACTVEPAGSSVSFYLSNDNETWFGVNHKADTSSYVSFGDHTPEQALDYVDGTADATGLVEELASIEEFDKASEAYLNAFITEDFSSLIPVRNIIVKRNINSSETEVLGTSPGWVIDRITGAYSTVVYVSNPEGRYLDFGPKGALLNGSFITGNTFIPQGYSKFSTDNSNWLALSASLGTETELKAIDPLYPYNHRYMIEGYSYPNSFTGDQIYLGVDEFFGRKLSYVSSEEFDVLERVQDAYYNVFTIEEVDDKLFLKVKVDKRSSTWKNEHFSLDFVVQSAATNKLYVKAVLSSNDSTLTPTVESFKARVV